MGVWAENYYLAILEDNVARTPRDSSEIFKYVLAERRE